MARKPSERMSAKESGSWDMSKSLIPVMNLMIILIPALLMATSFISIAVINVSTPKIGSAMQQQQQKKKKEEKKKLQLTIAITEECFIIAGAGGQLPGEEPKEKGEEDKENCTIPKKDGKYDYEALTEKLKQIKDQFPDETNVIISAEPKIPYKVLVKVMDASRETRDGVILFPDVSLSAGAG